MYAHTNVSTVDSWHKFPPLAFMRRVKPSTTDTYTYKTYKTYKIHHIVLAGFVVVLYLFLRNAFRDSASPNMTGRNSLARGTNRLASLLISEPSSASAPSSSSTTIISAYGVLHALSMLIPGAVPSSPSHTELLRTLYDGLDEADAEKELSALSSSLRKVLEEANAAFVSKSLSIQPGYRETLEASYDAEVHPLESADKVNSWVSEKTHEKITTIIDDSVAAQAALVLINAIYFKASWEHEFRPSDTNEMPFTRLNGSSVSAQMMYMKYEKTGTTFMSGWEFEVEGVACIAVRLRYQGGNVSAVFAMPKDSEGIEDDGISALYAEKLSVCQEAMLHRPAAWRVVDKRAGGYHSGKIFVPRFEVEAEHSLTAVLKERLGLSSIFRPGDFARLADGNLAVSEVKQKVFVKVDEEGTEAAAVTVRIQNGSKTAPKRLQNASDFAQHCPVSHFRPYLLAGLQAVIALRMMPVGPIDELFVRFDKPFYFGILHEDTGLHVFSGVVSL
jgi:serine protease inhibitor